MRSAVRDRWVPEVEAFLEIDYVPLSERDVMRQQEIFVMVPAS